MRKKKCLGCGKIFEDKISICQDCFNAIENVRNQFDSMPKGFKKQTFTFSRKYWLFIGVASIITILGSFLLLLSLIFQALAGLKYNLASLFSLQFVIIFLTLLIGLWIGNVLGKNSITECIKMLSNKDPYLSKAARRKALRKISLPFTLVILMFILVNESSSVFLRDILQSLCFLRIAFLHIILGILTGFVYNHYFRMSWVQRLSK